MTITPTAPTVTPCPVEPRIPEDAIPVGPCPSWCELPDGHPWNESSVFEYGDYGRTHERHVGFAEVLWTEVPGSPERPPVLNHEVVDTDSMAQAEVLIADLTEAARLAFGAEPATNRGDQDEFDAALAELVKRAGKPTDVNRLVAAAIRFRNAYLGA